MARKKLIILFLLGVGVNLLIAEIQKYPGYMDADYYLMGGVQLERKEGFQEWILWNYLDKPAGLPHPSHAYWMPLASIFSLPGLWIGDQLIWGRLLFLLFAGLVPVISAGLAFQFTNKNNSAFISGLLGVFSSFYLPFLGNTDTFGIYMVFGGLFFWWIFVLSRSPVSQCKKPYYWVIFGLIAGLMHLSRADGIMWLGLSWVASIYLQRESGLKVIIKSGLWIVIGYLLFMFPWFLRNFRMFGMVLSPGGSQALWLTNYDDLFLFSVDKLSFSNWLNSGLGTIVKSRLWALGQNLQTTIAVQGQIFLLPLIILGCWKEKKHVVISVMFWGWIFTFTLMTIIFPFAGARGGFFHSGAAFQPVFWSVVPIGLDVFLAWGTKVRRWNRYHSRRVFGYGVVILGVFLSFVIINQRFLGHQSSEEGWAASYRNYMQIDQYLTQLKAPEKSVVMVNNPPGFYLVSNRPAIVIPNGDIDELFAAAVKYNVAFLILDINHVSSLEPLYSHPENFDQRLQYLRTIEGIQIFRIIVP